MPHELIVEERYPTVFVKGERAARLSSNTFETLQMDSSPYCPCKIYKSEERGGEFGVNEGNSCSCYVAQISLVHPCIQFIDRPKERNVDCWDMESERHEFKFIMEPFTLIVKTDEALWNWRSRVAVFSDDRIKRTELVGETLLNYPDKEQSNRVITMKLCFTAAQSHSLLQQHLYFHDEKKDEMNVENLMMNKRLEELLTIVVTTSPIKSNPSTEVLEKTFATFHHGGEDFAYKCQKVIICDGCRIIDEEKNVSRKYSNAKQSLRNGIATNNQAANYKQFKVSLRKLCSEAENDLMSPFHNTR
jgi:hypothetical protein